MAVLGVIRRIVLADTKCTPPPPACMYFTNRVMLFVAIYVSMYTDYLATRVHYLLFFFLVLRAMIFSDYLGLFVGRLSWHFLCIE